MSETPNGAIEDAASPSPAVGFWVFVVFSVVAILASAFPQVRSVVLAIFTLPVRLIGWAVPGESVYEDASRIGAILGWLGWGALSALWVPLALAAVSIASRAFPGADGLGRLWSNAVSGRSGTTALGGAAVAAAAPIMLTIALVHAGRLLPWSLSLGAAGSAVLLAPAAFRNAHRPLASLTRTLASIIDYVNGLLGAATRWAALALVLVVATIVTQRYVFGVTFTKLSEIVVYLHAAMFMLMAAATLKSDGHVRVDVFYGSMGPRGQAFVNFLGSYLLLAPMCLVVLVYSGAYVDLAWRFQEGSRETDGLPLVFVLKTVIPAFGAILLAQAAALAARSALALIGEAADGQTDAAAAPPSA